MVDSIVAPSKPLARLGAAARVALIPLALGIGACDGDSETAPGAPEDTSSTTGGAESNATGGRTGSSGATAQGGAAPAGGSATTGGGTVGPTGGVSAAGGSTATAGMDFAVPGRGQVLGAQQLAEQLAAYDPGSLLRCDVTEDASYKAAIDALGGVTWGYNVQVLEDHSKPRYLAGVQRPLLDVASPSAGNDGRSVEIAVADVVAVTETAALFYSASHGLMIVGIEDEKPAFHCALPLPGHVNQFYFHQDHLVVMTKSQNNQSSQLLHFTVSGTELRFVETRDLGNVNVLDSRRFNEKLVFYTSFSTQPAPAPGGGTAPVQRLPQENHRALRVYRLGDTLEEELYDTLIDTSEPEQQLAYQLPRDTAPGTQVSEARTFGGSIWASDHYFVVTEAIRKTSLKDWVTNTYSVCTASHTTQTPYQYCWTEFETRPNPDYVEPDNSGGDRSCKGTTLSDCLVQVAKVSNKTIEVPVGRKCEERMRTNWFCDASEQRSVEYPTFEYDVSTRLFIYEYTDSGFVRVDSKVHEVTNQGLTGVAPDAMVDVITTSTESFDLAVPGPVQTLYFQNGYLYVISQGLLQVYAMGGSSIVRTATLPVVNETLQSSLFSSDRLFLSDFGWKGGDHSTLRVVDLANPAFPTLQGATHQLPGGHRSILATDAGIFTIGQVQNFMGQNVSALKLGLFSDPYAEETAYLILGTDLKGVWPAQEKAQFFNASSQRLLLPYSGSDEASQPVIRVGVSRIEPGTIESEGAVVLPELAQRVRPLATSLESYLTFATNSIEWLTPNQGEWKSEPVLEYLEPIALYRRTKDSEYVELQRLGRRCRLFFADDAAINQRADGHYSEEFTCASGYAQAYDRSLVLDATTGIEFADDHSIRALSAAEVEETRSSIAAREYCVLKLELVDNAWLDPKQDLPPHDQFTCMSPMEYAELQRELSQP